MFEISGDTIHVVGSIRVPSRFRKSVEFQAGNVGELKRILSKRLRHGLVVQQNSKTISLSEAQEKINLGQSKEDAIELLLYKTIKASSKSTTMNVALLKKAENLSLEILPGTRLAITKDGYRIAKKKWTKKLKRGDNLSWSYSNEKR